MKHERTIEGLRRSALARHRDAVQRTELGIGRLLLEERPVNFRTVAETARVSSAWLYRQPDIRQRIEHLRTAGGQPATVHTGQQTSRSAARGPSDASKDAMLATLRRRVKQLEEENRGLKAQLEVVYGQLRQWQERSVNDIHEPDLLSESRVPEGKSLLEKEAGGSKDAHPFDDGTLRV
jgi:hypothetical protein